MTNSTISKHDQERILRLRKHLAAESPYQPRWRRGDAVRLDNGCLGVVCEPEESKGSTPAVYYLDEENEIQGPSFGWECTLLDAGS